MRTTSIPFKGTGLDKFPSNWSQLVSYCAAIDARMVEDKGYTLKQGEYEKLLVHIKKHFPQKITLENGLQQLQKFKEDKVGLAIREAYAAELYQLFIEKIRKEVNDFLKLTKPKKAGDDFNIETKILKAQRTSEIAAQAMWNMLNLFEKLRQNPISILPGVVLDLVRGKTPELVYLFNYFQFHATPIAELNFVESFTQLVKFILNNSREIVAHVSTINPLSISTVLDNFGKLKEMGMVSSSDPEKVISDELTSFLLNHYEIQSQYDALKINTKPRIEKVIREMADDKVATTTDLHRRRADLLTEVMPAFQQFNISARKFKTFMPADVAVQLTYWKREIEKDEKTQKPIIDDKTKEPKMIWVIDYITNTSINTLVSEINDLDKNLFAEIDAIIAARTEAEEQQKRATLQHQAERARIDQEKINLAAAEIEAEYQAQLAAEFEVKKQAEEAARAEAEAEAKKQAEEAARAQAEMQAAERLKVEAVAAVDAALKAAEEVQATQVPVDEIAVSTQQASSASDESKVEKNIPFEFKEVKLDEEDFEPSELDSLSSELEKANRALEMFSSYQKYTPIDANSIISEIEENQEQEAEEKAKKTEDERAEKLAEKVEKFDSFAIGFTKKSTGPVATDEESKESFRRIGLMSKHDDAVTHGVKTSAHDVKDKAKTSKEETPIENIPYDEKAARITKEFQAKISSISDTPLPVVSETQSFSFKKPSKAAEDAKLLAELDKTEAFLNEMEVQLAQKQPVVDAPLEPVASPQPEPIAQRPVEVAAVKAEPVVVRRPAPQPATNIQPFVDEEAASRAFWQKHGGWIGGVITALTIIATVVVVVALITLFWHVAALLTAAALIKIGIGTGISALVAGGVGGVVTQGAIDEHYEKYQRKRITSNVDGVKNYLDLTKAMGAKKVSAPSMDDSESTSLSTSSSPELDSKLKGSLVPAMETLGLGQA